MIGARTGGRTSALGARSDDPLLPPHHRNKRLALPRLLCAPLALSEADLGVESEGLQSLLAKRREVEEEVSQHHVTPASRDPRLYASST